MIDKKTEYADMYRCYLQYEEKYWEWAIERKRFMQAQRERKYYRKNSAKNRRRYAGKVINDFPRLALSVRDLKSQIGGCMEIIKNLNMTKFDDEPFWKSDYTAFLLYDRLKNNPDEIYDAIEETYKWSIEVSVRTTMVAEKIPKVMAFIVKECLISGGK